MIRWLEDNPVGQALAAVAAALVIVMLLLGVIWSMPPGAGRAESDADNLAMRVDVRQLPDSPPVENFAVVTDRPVFNESRQPELEVDSDGDGEGNQDELADTMVDAPEFVLSGVVITPSLRMVTLRQKKAGEALVAFEGQPMHGDYGSWHVSRIAPREITLASGDGREVQLQLQVHKAKIAPPPEPKPEEVAQEQPAGDGEAGDEGERPLTRAEEIRQRIAERREELRRAAEAGESREKAPVSGYQAAIRSMIGTRPKPKESDDDK